MKKGIKISCLTLTLFFLITLLGSCSATSDYTEKSFSPEILSYARLEDMPLPESEVFGVKRVDDPENRQELYGFACTKKEFEAYVKTLAEYLRAKDDIYYCGYVDTSPSILIFIPDYTVCRIDDNFDCTWDEHAFQYSLSGRLDGVYFGEPRYESFDDVVEIRLEYGFFSENSEYDAVLVIMYEPRISSFDREYFTETETESDSEAFTETETETETDIEATA